MGSSEFPSRNGERMPPVGSFAAAGPPTCAAGRVDPGADAARVREDPVDAVRWAAAAPAVSEELDATSARPWRSAASSVGPPVAEDAARWATVGALSVAELAAAGADG